MTVRQRSSAALAASLKHLALSVLVALLCAGLVFGLWYPYPYDELVGGRELFLIVISVDVICGPLLTLVVFNPAKPRAELIRDIGIIVLLQFSALSYGLHTVLEARPVYLSYEGNRFRVVTLPEVDIEHLADTPESFRDFSLTGPKLIAAQLSKATDPDFRESIQLSLQGLPPSFRPGRWKAYDEAKPEVLEAAKPVAELMKAHSGQEGLIEAELKRNALASEDVVYLPLEAKAHSDWVVLIDRSTVLPVGFLPIDGW